MTANTSTISAICPRCQSEGVEAVAHSPVPGHWTMHSCGTCWYAWRTSEPPAATDPDRYPDAFRVNPDDIATMPRIV